MTMRVRGSLRWLIRVALPLVIVIAGWKVWDNIETRHLRQAFTPFASVQPPVASAPQQDDAARLYAAAAMLAVDPQASAVPSLSPLDLTRRRRQAMLERSVFNGDDLSVWEHLKARAMVSSVLLDRGASLPFGGFVAGTDFSYRASGVINAARLAEVPTLAALERRDADALFQSLRARMSFLRACAENPFLLEQRARLGQDLATDVSLALSDGVLSDAQLQSLFDSTSIVSRPDELEAAIDGMARFQFQFVDAATAGRTWQHGLVGAVVGPWLKRGTTNALNVFAEAKRIARQPWPERVQAIAHLNGPTPSFSVAALVGNVARAIGIFEATQRVVLTTIAVEQYRRQHQNLPAALADLDGPASMRQDPFSGDVLRYRADDSGFIIYSVGADGRDDGGRLEVAAGKGSAPGVGPLLDVGVRVTTRPS